MLPSHLKAIILVLACFVTTPIFLQAEARELETSTWIESYLVNTTIEARFARTDVVATFRNGRDCSAVRGFTLQLPRRGRVRSFSMVLSDGCEIKSKLLSEDKARESFQRQVDEGTPAAMLTAWDSTNYRVEVFIPSSGKSELEIHYEELLTRRQHEVSFQLPASPGVDVKSLELNVFVNEPQTGVSEFSLDDPGKGSFQIKRGANTASAHIILTDVARGALPRLLRGTYDTDNVPENGILMADAHGCATLFFNPTSFLLTGPMPRIIVFVIDVSGSMAGQKLRDAKAAFSTMITALTAEDNFAIHSFSSSGTTSLFESRAATSGAKSDAIAFVNNLNSGGGTNLNDAYIDGLDRIMIMERAIAQDGENVPILVILTDGQASSGVTDSREIAKSVRAKNEVTNAKIFALAFGFGADLSLLLGISIQNGGKAIPIYEGFGDAAQQMEGFFIGELGEVLMSDIEVDFGGDFGILQHTQDVHPVFASGTEIVSRAMMDVNDLSSGTLQATTKAKTLAGERVWTTELDIETVTLTPNNECAIGLAHARIAEILQFHEGALSLGDELGGFEPYAQTGGVDFLNKAEEAKSIALEVALEAGVVWPGLTALVTMAEGSDCAIVESTDVCSDGDTSGSNGNGVDEAEADSQVAGAPSKNGEMGTLSASSSSRGATLFLNALALAASLIETLLLLE